MHQKLYLNLEIFFVKCILLKKVKSSDIKNLSASFLTPQILSLHLQRILLVFQLEKKTILSSWWLHYCASFLLLDKIFHQSFPGYFYNFYSAPPLRPNGLRRCPQKGQFGGSFVLCPMFFSKGQCLLEWITIGMYDQQGYYSKVTSKDKGTTCYYMLLQVTIGY